MLKQVWVSNAYKQSLETAKWMGTGIQGFLIGRMLNEQLCVLNVWKSNASNPNQFQKDFQQCCLHLTGGLLLGGFFMILNFTSQHCIENDGLDEMMVLVNLADSRILYQNSQKGTVVLGIIFVSNNSLTDDMQTALQSLPGDIQNAATKNPFVLCILQRVAGQQVASFHLLGNEGKITELTEEPEEDLDKRIVTFRIKAQITLHLYVDSGKSHNKTWANKVRKAVSSVDEALSSGHFSYGIHESSVFLKESNIVGPKSMYTCQDLCAFINENDNVTHNRKKKVTPDQQSPVVVDMYRLINGEDNSFAHPSCAPAIHHKKGSFHITTITLPLDVLVEVHETETLSSLFQVFTNAVRAQLQAMKESLLQHSKENLFHIPEPFHFTIPSRHACVTVIYPRGFSESDLEFQRLTLHQQMCLAVDQPLFRRANARIFPGQTAVGGYIINPHVGLSPSGVKNGMPHLVKGNYTYHHYMQDRFDDDKWGCAYRSLQTLVSWFRYQGYTDKPIPSHREIQQALVDIGDKEQNFVGSKKWIGSFEVSFCLEYFLGVTSKFINVTSGSDLASKGRELAQHFDTQGTPIMIGGGVLAHTILGVDYSETTGDIKYLILDPHYTGGENLETVQREGWCGWKDTNFWQSAAHYNLCMPQKPNII